LKTILDLQFHNIPDEHPIKNEVDKFMKKEITENCLMEITDNFRSHVQNIQELKGKLEELEQRKHELNYQRNQVKQELQLLKEYQMKAQVICERSIVQQYSSYRKFIQLIITHISAQFCYFDTEHISEEFETVQKAKIYFQNHPNGCLVIRNQISKVISCYK
jgi:TolA-binding protein